jgi:hypothetical protein
MKSPTNNRSGNRLRITDRTVAEAGPCPVTWTSCCSRSGATVLSCRAIGIWERYSVPSFS